MKRIAAGVLLAAAAGAFPAPFVFILPGLAIALLHEDKHPFSLGIPLSFAFWPVFLQVLYWLHFPARIPATVALAAAAAIVAWRWRRPEIDRLAAGILGVAVLFRLIPALISPCAPGIDMSFHTFLGGRIAEEGVPRTLAPLADDPVRGLPIGFHLLMASMGLSPNASALWLSAAVYAVLTIAVFRGLAGFFPAGPSALAAVLVTFLAHRPQSAIRYGSNPLVLGFALIALAVALWCEGMRSRVRPWPVAILAAGAALVHPTPAWGALLILAPAALVDAGRRFTRDQVLRTAAAVGLSLLFLLPFVLVNERTLTPEMIEWTRQYLRRTTGNLYEARALARIPAFFMFIRHELGPGFIGLGLLAFGYALWRKRALAAFQVAAMAGLAVAAVNVALWVLPMSVLGYPDRLVYFLILPVAAIAAAAIAEGHARWGHRRWAVVAAVAFVALAAGERGANRYLRIWRGSAVVTQDDFAAMEWIRANTAKDDVFENGPEDAGLWIPAFTGRRITRPQGAPTYFAIREARPDYAYRPKEPPPGGTIVFEKGEAVLYALRQP